MGCEKNVWTDWRCVGFLFVVLGCLVQNNIDVCVQGPGVNEIAVAEDVWNVLWGTAHRSWLSRRLLSLIACSFIKDFSNRLNCLSIYSTLPPRMCWEVAGLALTCFCISSTLLPGMSWEVAALLHSCFFGRTELNGPSCRLSLKSCNECLREALHADDPWKSVQRIQNAPTTKPKPGDWRSIVPSKRGGFEYAISIFEFFGWQWPSTNNCAHWLGLAAGDTDKICWNNSLLIKIVVHHLFWINCW